MGWVIKRPKRYDFCGRPPCPLCFNWQEPEAKKITPGIVKLALDVLGRAPNSDDEVAKLEKIAETIHEKGVAGLSPQAPPDDSGATFEMEVATVDIGMSSLTRINMFLRQQPKKKEIRKPMQLTCDHIYAMKAEAAKEKKRMAAAMRAEKKRVREMAKLLRGD